MKIALAQMKMETDLKRNFQASLQAIEKAAQSEADLIFFPELQFYPFFPQYKRLNREQYVLDRDHEFIQGIIVKSRELGIMSSPNLPYFSLRRKECYL